MRTSEGDKTRGASRHGSAGRIETEGISVNIVKSKGILSEDSEVDPPPLYPVLGSSPSHIFLLFFLDNCLKGKRK